MTEQDIYSYALGLREEVGLSVTEAVPPIVGVVEGMGYRYHEDDFGNDFSGYSLIQDDVNAIIGFNINHRYNKGFHRFTVSHELGHLTMEDHRRQIGNKPHRSRPEYQSNSTIEREADYFASCFLAPPMGVRALTKTKDFNSESVRLLSDQYGISFYAAAIQFVKATDLSCVLIKTDNSGRIIHDSRSRQFQINYRPEQIRGSSLSRNTVTADVISGGISEDAEIDLMEWYPNIEDATVRCIESAVKMDYGNMALTMLTILE